MNFFFSWASRSNVLAAPAKRPFAEFVRVLRSGRPVAEHRLEI
jgi:hypothetical protein